MQDMTSPMAHTMPQRRERIGYQLIFASVLLLCAAVLVSLSFGATGITLGALGRVLHAYVYGATDAAGVTEQLVLLGIRLPRTILGAFVGAALAVSGFVDMISMNIRSMITALATLIGLTFAALGAEALHYWLQKLATSLPPWWSFGVDLNVALFAVGAAAVSATLAVHYPALRVSGIDVNGVLRDGARDTGLSTGRIVRWLVVAEIALSCALLTCTGLMIRTALTVSSGDVGVPVAGVFSGRIGLTGEAYTPDRQRAVIERLERDLRALPGVSAAGLVSGAPGLGAGSAQYALAGRSYASRTDYPNAKLVPVSPGFFDTFQVELRAGRTLRDADRDGALPVAVVSESFAKTAFPDSNPLGQRIHVEPQSDTAEWVTIVGVVENVRHDDSPFTLEGVPPTIYRPLAQAPVRFFHAVLTGAGAPASHSAALRETLRAIDPDLAAYWLRTIDEARRQEASGLTVIGAMFAVFAIVAVVLAASGIYGVLSYSVAQGAREIAIRRALGAPDGRIARAVLGRSAWQLGLGLALGLLSAPLMAVVIGALVLAGLYSLFGETILPTLKQRIIDMFNYGN